MERTESGKQQEGRGQFQGDEGAGSAGRAAEGGAMKGGRSGDVVRAGRDN